MFSGKHSVCVHCKQKAPQKPPKSRQKREIGMCQMNHRSRIDQMRVDPNRIPQSTPPCSCALVGLAGLGCPWSCTHSRAGPLQQHKCLKCFAFNQGWLGRNQQELINNPDRMQSRDIEEFSWRSSTPTEQFLWKRCRQRLKPKSQSLIIFPAVPEAPGHFIHLLSQS